MTLANPSPTGESLPTKDDFNPWGPTAFDAEHAWKMFGGSTLEEARRIFLDRPDLRQEDFMFMGGKAFAYYFPIIEDYLRGAQNKETLSEDRQAWILAKCILNQFRQSTRGYVLPLVPRILTLSQFVRENLQPEHEHDKISEAWAEVESTVTATRE